MLTTPHENQFTMFSANARSLVKNKIEYEALFQEIKIKTNHNFDVLSFTETWSDSNTENLLHFENYHSIIKHKTERKEGGGIAMFVKESLLFHLRPDLSLPPDRSKEYDSLFIEMIHQTAKMLLLELFTAPPVITIFLYSLTT